MSSSFGIKALLERGTLEPIFKRPRSGWALAPISLEFLVGELREAIARGTRIAESNSGRDATERGPERGFRVLDKRQCSVLGDGVRGELTQSARLRSVAAHATFRCRIEIVQWKIRRGIAEDVRGRRRGAAGDGVWMGRGSWPERSQ